MSRSRYRAHPLVLRCVQVRAVTDVTPRMRRVTVGGEQLGAFTRDGMSFPAFAAPAFDDHIKLIFAPGADITDALPRQQENGIDWLPSEHRVTRDYTPHHHDPQALEMQLDFVVHTDGDASGPAEHWVRSAQPGDDLWFAGPKASTVMPDDVAELLLIGDETAIPAIARFFAERPLDVPTRAILVVASQNAMQDIAIGDGDRLDWVIGAPGDRDALLTAVTDAAPVRRPAYVWASAESRALLPLRRLVTRDWGIPKSHTDITGYWHIRDEPADAAADGESPSAGVPVMPIGSPVAWMATRAALRLGVIDTLAGGGRSRGEVATATTIPVASLDSLLGVLVPCGVLGVRGDEIVLGPVGERFLDDEHAREEFDGLYAEQVLALGGLADALQAGRPAWAEHKGDTLRTHVAASAENYAELVEEAEGLVFLMPALAALPLWSRCSRIAIGGPAALVVADGLRTGGVRAALTVVEEPAPLAALRSDDPPPGVDFADEWGAPDAAVLAGAVEHRTDDEIIEHLEWVRAATDTLLLVESTEADALNARAAEMAVVALGAVGAPPRTGADLKRLAHAAGWSVASATALGWGVECLELSPTQPG